MASCVLRPMFVKSPSAETKGKRAVCSCKARRRMPNPNEILPPK